MEYFVASTYENWERIGSPYEKEGRMYTSAKQPCDRCFKGMYISRIENGQPVPHPCYGGICLKCHGTGYIEKEIRLYSKSEKDAMERAKARKEEKNAEAARVRAANRLAEVGKKREEWLTRNGWSLDGITYSVCGDDTYSIKDYLKEQGCKFDPTLKWHCAEPIELPEGFKLVQFNWSDLMAWQSDFDATAFFYEDAKAKIERAFRESEGPSLSEYVGEVGQRLRNITAIFKSTRGFSGKYGWTNIHTFQVGDNILVWFTASEIEFEAGQVVDLTGTIKGHEEFRGVKTTQLSRCIIKEVV